MTYFVSYLGLLFPPQEEKLFEIRYFVFLFFNTSHDTQSRINLYLLVNISSASAATASLSKVWSITFDSLIGNHISQALEGTFSPYMPSFLATFPDFVALALLLVMIGEKGTETG